jgi:exodeoxyribonuclease V alpha subunit
MTEGEMPPIYKPKNRAAVEHRGTIERIVFSDPSAPFVIALLTDDATVCGEATADQLVKGAIFRFFGKWTDDEKRGPRFRFSTFTIHAAHSRGAVVRYLSEHCEGIGQKTAARIFEKYRGESVATLRSDPEKVAAECGLALDLCETAAKELERGAKYEDTKVELFGLFQGRGFSGKLIETCIDTWGVRAPTVIKRNPFALLGKPSAGFKRCDRLWSDLGLPKTALKRASLCAWNVLRNDSQGHTWVAVTDVAERLKEAVPGCDIKRALKLAIRARKLKKHVDRAGDLWLGVYHRATSEERIVAAIERLSAASCLWPTDRIPVSQQEGDRLPSAHQVERLMLATEGPVGMLLGGPGTGKTHVTGYLLREVIKEFGRGSIKVCAPTGKAAVRATQALSLAGIDLTARTIHSTLEIGRNGHDGDGWGFLRDQDNPLECQFLVCDETSMNDTDLMADLLDACAVGTHVLLIGDPHQLPPVGHGAPLRDMVAAGVPHGELTEVRRNAGQIVHACVRIKNGESFDTAERVDLDATPPKNLRLIEGRNEQHSREQLLRVLKQLDEKKQRGDSAGFDPTWQTQVIVARNTKGDICRKKLNELLHPMLNPDGYAVAGNPFKVGDKIICTKNSRMHQVEAFLSFDVMPEGEKARALAENYETVRDPDQQPVEVYVANGEIGRVVAVAPKLTIARFSEGDGLVKIPMGKQREEDEEGAAGEDDGGGRGCSFDHAYAITCHKCQGSEAPCVIVMGDEQGGMIANREWIYTAISRASKLCILIGKMSTFTKMKDRRSLHKRKTFLRELILDAKYAEL